MDWAAQVAEYKKDIEKDFLENGYSAILDKISNEKKINGCDCVNKNPKKR